MKEDNRRAVKVTDLHSFCMDLFKAVSVPEDEADIIVSSLIEADRRGVNSHGVVCVPRYVSLIRTGKMRRECLYKVERDFGPISVWDGMRSNGQVLGYKAMKCAIGKALVNGLGLVAVKRSNHFGAGAFYALLAEKENMIGIVASTGSPTMAPWGGADRMIGNNPIAIAVPTGRSGSLVLDMAQSTVAYGKITNYAKEGIPTIPQGWAFDADGVETTDTAKAYSVIPIGNHKGFGLALMIDILSGILFGGATGERAGDKAEGPSHVFIAVNIDAFGDRSVFTDEVNKRISELKSSRLAVNSQGIFMPGEIESLCYERSKETLKILFPIIDDLNSLGKELGIKRNI